MRGSEVVASEKTKSYLRKKLYSKAGRPTVVPSPFDCKTERENVL